MENAMTPDEFVAKVIEAAHLTFTDDRDYLRCLVELHRVSKDEHDRRVEEVGKNEPQRNN